MRNVAVMLAVCGAGLGFALPVQANDTSAELAAGGLIFTRSDVVEMVREDLYISPELIKIDYVFENTGNEDVSTIVAFPMPDIDISSDYEVSIPNWSDENFMDFTVKVNGDVVEPSLQQRAMVSGVDVTRELVKRGVPVASFEFLNRDMGAELDVATIRELEDLGLLYVSRINTDSGIQYWVEPLWTFQSTYYWTMMFPANEKVYVTHTYMPSVGASAGLGFDPYSDESTNRNTYAVQTYCVDEPFMAGLRNRLDDGMIMWESWVSYILSTGANWYRPIGTFHLTVDKMREENLVSWCGEGITKTGPTTFEVTIEDFYPDNDLDILFIQNVVN